MSVFTRIINREIPAYIIYEDDVVIAFLDITQKTRGHTLVVTKKSYATIFELDDSTAKHVFLVTVKLARLLQKKLGADGLNMINNNGIAAEQSVNHYHIHLLPRYSGEKMDFFNDKEPVSPETLEALFKELT